MKGVMNEDSPANRRRYARLNTGVDYRVRVVHDGQVLERAQLMNISACGCGIQVHLEEIPGVEVGLILPQIYLLHEDLPLVPLQGTVVYMLGKHAGKVGGSVFLGVDFAPITPFLVNLIDQHVLSQSR